MIGQSKETLSTGTMRKIIIIKDSKINELFFQGNIKNNGAVYLKDIATVSFEPEDNTTFAREFGSSVVMLDVKKRSGTNMIQAVNSIKDIIMPNLKELWLTGNDIVSIECLCFLKGFSLATLSISTSQNV